MSRLEKLKERILSKPKDYTYTEAKNLLRQLGVSDFMSCHQIAHIS